VTPVTVALVGRAETTLGVCALALALGCEATPPISPVPPVDEQAQVFDATGIGRVELTLTAEALDELESDPEAEIPVPGDFSYTSPDGTFQRSLSNVGIRFKGNTSLDARLSKLPMKVRFNEFVKGQKFAGMKKLGFGTEYGDPTFVREALSYSLARKAGTLAPRTRPGSERYCSVPHQ
jgi:spore coat protein H